MATLHDLISLDLRAADYPAARDKLQRSLKIFEEIGDLAGQAGVLRNMASIDQEKGDLDIARSEFQRSLEIRQKLGGQGRAGRDTAQHGDDRSPGRRHSSGAREVHEGS